jgi:hypothetical protein
MLASGAHRKPITSITSVLLPFVTHLLTLLRMTYPRLQGRWTVNIEPWCIACLWYNTNVTPQRYIFKLHNFMDVNCGYTLSMPRTIGNVYLRSYVTVTASREYLICISCSVLSLDEAQKWTYIDTVMSVFPFILMLNLRNCWKNFWWNLNRILNSSSIKTMNFIKTGSSLLSIEKLIN